MWVFYQYAREKIYLSTKKIPPSAKQRLTITASQAGTVTNDLKEEDTLRAREDALRLYEGLKTDP